MGAAGARWWAGEEVVRVLSDRGLTWGRRDDTFGGLVLSDITGPGLTAETVRVALIPAPAVTVSGVDVDLQALRNGRTPSVSAATRDPSPAPFLPPVDIKDLRVRWGEDPVVEGWSGSLLPQIQLSGPGGSVQRTLDGTWEGSLQQPVDIGPLSGAATVQARCGTDCRITVDVPEAVLEHPMLASGPLPSTRVKAALTWSESAGTVDGELQVGALRADLSGTLAMEPQRSADLRFEVHDTPLEAIVDLFGEHIPEARRARMVGTLGASGTFAWPSLDWSLQPRMDGLGVEGVLVDIDGLRNGTVTWATLDAEGVPRMRRTGRNHAHYVPFQAAGRFPAAVLAAEDSGFSRHRGVDLVAIQAALDDAREHGISGMRGGSTISQQLAKNLFLETRERTLARKLRELLYTLEMDRVVPKQRILELYINVVELGDNIYGVGAAAEAYFLKQPGRLTIEETAFLAALLPAPRSRGERAWRGGRPPRARMAVIIDNMRELKRITPEEADRAKRTSLRLVPPP